jgi:hypothetical protein
VTASAPAERGALLGESAGGGGAGRDGSESHIGDRWPSHTHVPPFPRGATPTEAVRIGAADVLISSSEIAHSPSDGIRVEVATDVRVENSNIRYNGGFGLRNVAADAVDARHNWWGDPVGPDGPQGDGVSGAVEYEPFRTEPVVVLGGSANEGRLIAARAKSGRPG